MYGLLIELLANMPLLPHFVLQFGMYLLEFLELSLLRGQIIVHNVALVGQVLLGKHVVLNPKLHDFEDFARIRGRLPAVGLPLYVCEGDLLHVLADVVREVGGVP